LEDDDVDIVVTRFEDVNGKVRSVFVWITYKITSSDREAAQNDVFSMGGDFEESRKVNEETHAVRFDARSNITKYEVEYARNGKLIAKRDLLASFDWVAKPIQERGLKYHQRALEKGRGERINR
jgi:hypothetical protein